MSDGKPFSPTQKILGINFLVLFCYTLLSYCITDGILLDALLIAIHVICCLIMSIIYRSLLWLLSAFLVLSIGFSTCVYGVNHYHPL